METEQRIVGEWSNWWHNLIIPAACRRRSGFARAADRLAQRQRGVVGEFQQSLYTFGAAPGPDRGGHGQRRHAVGGDGDGERPVGQQVVHGGVLGVGTVEGQKCGTGAQAGAADALGGGRCRDGRQCHGNPSH